jgi:hypothetical protein
MKAKEWLGDYDGPSCRTIVWVAIQHVNGGVIVVHKGYKNSNGQWCSEMGSLISEWGCHVLGWLPITTPTYECKGEQYD